MKGFCRVIAVIVPLVVLTSTALSGTDVSSVKVEELRSTDGANSVVKALVRNSTTERVEVNVAVEKLVNNQWIEILASITDSKHPYGKTVRITPLDSGATLPISFKPFAKYNGVSALKPSATPLSLRLRVDVYGPHGGKLVEAVWSSVFFVSAVGTGMENRKR